MKKVILIVAIVLVFGGFILFQNKQAGDSNLSTSNNNPSRAQTPENSSMPATTYKDGSYIGQVVSASQYGDIQVKVTVTGSKITDIEFLKSPDSSGHSIEVSTSALPILKQEAISSQSANVDIVSGATQTTEGFIESLQSALDQAKV